MANEIWSSDATYPAGADPWSGTPTKVAIDVGEIAVGHTPGLVDAAQHENWWKNRTDTRLSAIEADDITGERNVLIDGDVEADNLYFSSTETKQLDIHGTNYGSFGTTNSGDKESTVAAQVHDVVIDLPLGAKVWGYSFRLKGNGADDFTHKLVKITDGVEVDLGAVTMPAPSGAAWQTVFNNFAPVDVIISQRLVIRFTAGGNGQRVGAPTVDWTRPAP